ncbi:NAD(P)-binding protein [Sarocladium strictum]
MAVLVTGGAGFLGHHLIKKLLESGRDVIALDSLWTGSVDNIRDFEKSKHFAFIKHDVRDALPITEPVDEIYHLACPASPDQFENAIDILDTCYQGTRNVLEFAVKHNARVLLASTSEVYGDPTVPTQAETYFGNVNCFGPRSCYDEGKRISEALCYSYHTQHNLSIRVARIFNSYGPYMDFKDGRAVPNFIAAAMENRTISIYGDGYATRCFQYATDCIAGMVKLMKSDYDKPVNLGSDLEMSVGDIARMVAKVVAEKMGREEAVGVELLPKRKDDPMQRKPEVAVARDVLGWETEVSLEEGMAMTVDWFLERRKKMTNGHGTHKAT